jgi:hypothetical protein
MSYTPLAKISGDVSGDRLNTRVDSIHLDSNIPIGTLAALYTALGIEARIQQLIGGAPAALDTLGEIASKLADEDNAIAALVTGLAGKQAKLTGSSTQYVKGDGSYATFPTLPNNTDNLTEGANNLYFTAARAQAASRMIVDGVQRLGCFSVTVSATVGILTAGNAVFYLTDNGLAGGNALFPNNVFLKTRNFATADITAPCMYGIVTVSADRKTLTVPVTKSTGVTVAGITVLGAPVAAAGSVIDLTIWGN